MLGTPVAFGDRLPPADQGRQGVAPLSLKSILLRRRSRRRFRGRRLRFLTLLLLLEGHAVAAAGVALVEDDLDTDFRLNF